MTYKNMRNDKLAELLDRREDGATLKLLENDEIIEVGIPTLKRWWKAVPDAAPENNDARPEAQQEPAEPEATEPEATEPEATEPETTETGTDEAQDTPTEPTTAPIEPECDSPTDNKAEDKKPAGEALKLSEVVQKLENLFDILNGLYYENKLPRPVITIQLSRPYAHCFQLILSALVCSYCVLFRSYLSVEKGYQL